MQKSDQGSGSGTPDGDSGTPMPDPTSSPDSDPTPTAASEPTTPADDDSTAVFQALVTDFQEREYHVEYLATIATGGEQRHSRRC